MIEDKSIGRNRGGTFEEENYTYRDHLRKEKDGLKLMQKNIEKEKRKWRDDKMFLEANPDLATQEKWNVLDKVKQNLERQIDELNEKISDYKQKERLFKKREMGIDVLDRDDSPDQELNDTTTNQAFENRWKHVL